MKKTMMFRRALLGVAATAALVSTIAAGTSVEQNVQSKRKNGTVSLAAHSPDEEMVAGFIVKPHRLRGKKLGAALRAHDAREMVDSASVAMTVARAMSDDAHVMRLQRPIKLSEARVIAARMMRNSNVELAEPDRIMYPAAVTPSDPGYAGAPTQWHYMAPAGSNKGGANLPKAWDITIGSASITVAVLDTGYRQHADLAAVLPGYDFISSTTTANDGGGRDADASDPGDWEAANECGSNQSASASSWHGTHVAGTIAALMNNGVGGTGVAPNVKILPVRVLGKCGGATSDIVDAMRWAAGLYNIPSRGFNPNVAQVLNMSLGASGSCSSAFQSAVTDVVNAGKVIVAAAGNAASVAVSQPANCAGVIAVTAHAVDGDNADYASIGPEVAISAPGGGCGTLTTAMTCSATSSANGLGVYSLGNAGSTTPGSDIYDVKMGTSMAAPHVAGVVALMLSINPTLTPAQVKSYLQSTSRSHPALSTCTLTAYSGKCGAGLLDAEAALTKMIAPTVSLSNASQVVSAGASVTLSGSAVISSTGSASAITSYAWTQDLSNPAVLALSGGNTNTASFTAPATGTYAFTLSATDNLGNTGTAKATVQVNTAPVLTTVAPQAVAAGDTLHFSVSATDVDGDALIFHSINLPASATLSAAGVFHWPSATPIGSYTLTYYASDSNADSLPGTVDITVLASPTALSAPSGGTSGTTSGGGGGSMDNETLIGMALLAAMLRIRRVFALSAAKAR